MKANLKISALLIFVAILASGCVTHRFFINLAGTPSLRYTVEGDSLDVHDQLLALPEGDPWTRTAEENGDGGDGEPASRITWAVSPLSSVELPVAAAGSGGSVTVKRRATLIHEQSSLHITFPSWEAKKRFGDVDQYMPKALMEALEDPLFDSMHPGKREELQHRLNNAQVNAAKDRYEAMLLELVHDWYNRNQQNFDDETYAEATARYRMKIKQLADREKESADEPDTDWYDALRTVMAEAAMGITGVPSAQMMLALDSLELRYKRYLDLTDDHIEIVAVMPGLVNSSVAPDTVMGDTLIWDLSSEAFANDTVIIEASAWQPRWPGLILLLVLIQVVASTLLAKRARRGEG